MLQTLHVRDLALIGRAEIRFDAGLNVLSGTTGGGKSLIVTALKLLRGEKAAGGLVRHGADELRVDGEFLLGGAAAGRAVADAVARITGRELEDGVLVVTRIVDARGRSRVRIDGRPATLHDLREVCAHLLEIHGQGETRALMRPEIQAETLDAFGGISALRDDFGRALEVARAVRAQLDRAVGGARERRERAGFLRFQLAEIDGFGIEPGEVERVEADHRVLAHLDGLREALGGALAALQDADDSASDRLGHASRALDGAVGIDAELAPARELVAEARLQVSEAARLVQSRLGDLDLDPRQLSAVEERLATVRRALARFGPTEADLFRCRDAAAAELDALDAEDGGPDALEAELGVALAALEAAGARLVDARRTTAGTFVAAVEAELADLGMPHTRVRVAMDDAVPSGARMLECATAHGPGPLDFEVRINPGEPFRSMRDTASGGETARLVLAIKKGLADRDRVPFVVFDEIDAEIGGRLGLQVGRKLRDVAVSHQTLIVTHLPQVAAFADAHFRVDKEVRQDRTWTTVGRLEGEVREQELAAMAAGEGADADAVAEARRLVERAQRARGGRKVAAAAGRGGVRRPKPLQVGELSAGA